MEVDGWATCLCMLVLCLIFGTCEILVAGAESPLMRPAIFLSLFIRSYGRGPWPFLLFGRRLPEP